MKLPIAGYGLDRSPDATLCSLNIRGKSVIFPLVVGVHELKQIGKLRAPAGLLTDLRELALAVDYGRKQSPQLPDVHCLCSSGRIGDLRLVRGGRSAHNRKDCVVLHDLY